jgi:hypothetical protein
MPFPMDDVSNWVRLLPRDCGWLMLLMFAGFLESHTSPRTVNANC